MKSSDFIFIDKNWSKLFEGIRLKNYSQYKFITPFIQLNTIKFILNKGISRIKLITRYSLVDFYNGVSSLDALKYLLDCGAEIKGIKNLHSKLYMFDSKEAILSSANLTQAALLRNYEFGLHTIHQDIIKQMEIYFDTLWNSIPSVLKKTDIDKWTSELDSLLKSGKSSYSKPKLNDYGYDLNTLKDVTQNNTTEPFIDDKNYFVKFFGEGHNRIDRGTPVIDEIKSSGCHWACQYPANKTPRNVHDGDTMFMGRLVFNPNDIIIFGYATGNSYDSLRDNATPYDISIRPWKSKWPKYIRVHDGHFIDGKLENGVSLNFLMDTFGHNSFMSTYNNHKAQTGNVNPRKAYNQQASVQLTQLAAEWLLNELNSKLKFFGQISNNKLSNIE